MLNCLLDGTAEAEARRLASACLTVPCLSMASTAAVLPCGLAAAKAKYMHNTLCAQLLMHVVADTCTAHPAVSPGLSGTKSQCLEQTSLVQGLLPHKAATLQALRLCCARPSRA